MLPDIVKPDGIRKTVQVSFGGIDLRPEAADGTFAKTVNMSSDKSPVMASRPKRRAAHSEGQIQYCDLYGMDGGIFANIDGFFYYNGVAVGAASAQGGGELIPFGNKIIIPWTREIVDLTYRPKGYVNAVASLPANPSEGDAYVVNQADPEISYHMYVYESGAWTDKGPIKQSLEASATIDNLDAEFLCGTYQGEDAAWNTIRCWDSTVELGKLFKPGDAVTIEGCVNQPWNNQTLIIREIKRNELRFYENSFKQAYLGKRLFYPEDFTYDNDQWFEVTGEELPDNKARYFKLDATIKASATSDVDEPDVALYYRVKVWNTSALDNTIVAFYHWDQQNDAYTYYGSTICYEYDPSDPLCPVSGDIIDLLFEKLEKHPLSNNVAYIADEHYYEDRIKISKVWPEGLQGVFADSNRLWGWCGHQIRCSKLGDPGNWEFFDGTAEDAWAVDVHDPDAFTGGISVHGYPTFFTEHKRYRIYGSEPEAYQLAEQDCNGVREGCAKSMVTFDGALYYVSRVGIMQDTGAVPACVSEALGLLRLHEAVAGGHLKRYYVTGKDEDGNRHNLVLDTRNGVWIDEGARDVRSYAAACGIMHEAEFSGSTGETLTIWARGTGSPLGDTDTVEQIDSVLETNDYTMAYPNRKRVHRVQLRFVIGSGASLAVAIQYDGDGTWIPVKEIAGDGKKRSVYLPVIPRRCDHFRLKFAGSGDWELYSLALDLKQGSAVF